MLLWRGTESRTVNVESEQVDHQPQGFDSGSGGCPSPIFPDGTMFSLPIPSGDEEAFEDLQHGDIDIASVVSGITNGRMGGLNWSTSTPT